MAQIDIANSPTDIQELQRKIAESVMKRAGVESGPVENNVNMRSVSADEEKFKNDLADHSDADIDADDKAFTDAFLKLSEDPPFTPTSESASIGDSEDDSEFAQIQGAKSENDIIHGDAILESHRNKGKLQKYFTKRDLKFIYCLSLSIDFDNNNQKSEILSAYFKDRDFKCLGTGTNRVAFKKGEYVYKFALDRRGQIDNWMEFLRAKDAPNLLAHTYECNGIIAVAEYVDMIDIDAFNAHRREILEALHQLSFEFIIGDMGYTPKNYCNIGIRHGQEGDALVFLDYAYLHTRLGNEKAFSCGIDGFPLKYTSDYAQYKCPHCGRIYDYRDILPNLNRDDNYEAKFMAKVAGLEISEFDFDNLTMDI